MDFALQVNNLLKEAEQKKKDQQQNVERYDGSQNNSLGLAVLSLVLWVMALVFLIKSWDMLATWAKWLCVFCMICVPYGSLITLGLIYAFRQNYLQKFRYRY